MGRWIEVAKKTAENDGDTIQISGFKSKIVKITGVISSTTDNVGYQVSVDPKDKLSSNRILCGQSLDSTMRPFLLVMETVENYVIADMPCLHNLGFQSKISRYTCYCPTYENDGTITFVSIMSTNGKLSKGSWIKVEVWEE